MADDFVKLHQLIRETALRHKVLASNIANVDTPNYRARDVAFGQVMDNELAMAATAPGHIRAAAASPSGKETEDPSQPWADKNNVELDKEVAKMTENALLQQAAVTLLEKRVAMFKSALRTT